MNKIKLLYDVTRAMKNLVKIEGVLQVKVHRDDEEVFSMRNAFEKNEAGKTRTTVSSVLNLDGGQVTRESTTEFDLSGRCHPRPRHSAQDVPWAPRRGPMLRGKGAVQQAIPCIRHPKQPGGGRERWTEQPWSHST